MASGLSSLAIRTALLVSLAGALFLTYPEPAYACKCVVPGSPSEEMAKFAMVFQGRVVSVHELDRGDDAPADGGELRVEFEVETVWKGNVRSVDQPDDATRRRSLWHRLRRRRHLRRLCRGRV